MSTVENKKELFRQTTIAEIISMFQSLLDALDIQPEEALALAGAIHAGLRNPQGMDRVAYARYAQAMALLNHHLPDVHQHVVTNWRLPKPRSSASERAHNDSLFDDTAVMPIPGSKSP
ncbi:MAG: hypothetical protein IPP66_04150 [Anaerolineales bacterium]|nr:hypothetical protein [Anaerolineales bacterium]